MSLVGGKCCKRGTRRGCALAGTAGPHTEREPALHELRLSLRRKARTMRWRMGSRAAAAGAAAAGAAAGRRRRARSPGRARPRPTGRRLMRPLPTVPPAGGPCQSLERMVWGPALTAARGERAAGGGAGAVRGGKAAPTLQMGGPEGERPPHLEEMHPPHPRHLRLLHPLPLPLWRWREY